MTGREITSLAIKVFAIYVLVRAVLTIPVLVQVLYGLGGQAYLNPESAWSWGLGAVAVLSLLVLFVVLWRLANKFVPPADQRSTDDNVVAVDGAFVLSVLGFYLTFEGLMRIAFLSIGAYASMNHSDGRLIHDVKWQTIAHLLCYLLQAAVGLSLILRGNGWAALLNRLRHAGLKAKPPVNS
ncbi:MAG: hypothetical protein P8009_03190 [Gammaproteobacteria bacterium]